ncbi:MAG TPA: aminotransferase class V-fold PLP-dependent enzyme [Thermoanaerobaculia bacterium]
MTLRLSRRALLRGLAATAAPILIPRASAAAQSAARAAAARGASDPVRDETYWSAIARAFDTDRTLVNLNHGGVSPAPTSVLEAMVRDLRFSNVSPAYQMWQILEPRLESVRRELAREFGCDPEEIAVTRNASEAMETLILGIPMSRGDEAVITTQNYPRMLTTWEQRARREGIVLRKISFPVPLPSPAVFLAAVEKALTSKTKVVELPHLVNWTGQILPVRDVVRLCRPRGIEVLVDGAHAFAHFPFRRDDLECDYYGTSLHKWLFAPIGTGFLYVRREKIPAMWPLMAAPEKMAGDIRKFEEIGTHPAANHNAIADALAFHRAVGSEAKAARLRGLRDRWARRVAAASPKVRIRTNLDGTDACGMALLDIEGVDPEKLTAHLWEKHRIISVAIVHEEFRGLRITPSLSNLPEEIDFFAEKIEEIAARPGLLDA